MKKLFQIIVNNGIIISIAIGMANLFAYYYQKGKLDYYDIPLIYVDLSIITIIQMVGLILSACILIFVLVNAVLESSFGVEDYRLCNMIIRTIFMLVVSSISIAFVRKLTYATLILLALYFITIITDYLMPIIKIKEKVSYSEKWKKYSELAREKNKEEDKIKNTGKFAKFRKNLLK